MKKLCIVFLCLFSVVSLVANVQSPVADIVNMISYINADTLEAYVQHLQDYQTRYALADNNLEVATWLRNQFESYGFTNTWLQSFQSLNSTQYNVIATIPGYLYPDTYIIVGAHYDSQALDSDDYIFAPGADDNASGTAALLEMARVMKLTGYQPQCSIRFIGFAIEEINAMGSQTYCNYATNNNHEIRVMLNLDMIASNDPVSNEFRIVPYIGAEDYCLQTAWISSQYCALQPVQEGPAGSDSGVFARNGYKATMFFERYISPFWHNSGDIIDHLDFAYAVEILKAAMASTAVFANQPVSAQNLRVYDTGSGNSLLAQWESTADPSISTYALYYGTDINNLALGHIGQETQFLISGLSEGQIYHIAVASVDQNGYPGMRIFDTQTALSIPRIPQSIKDHPGNTSITIAWVPNKELDIHSYKVFRSLSMDGTFVQIGIVYAPEASFTDHDVINNGEYYYYRVCAVDNQANQSAFSQAISSRTVSLNRGIMVIDESKNFAGTSPFQPSDEALDEFYANLLEGFAEVHHLDLEEQSETLRLADIGVYSSILWHGNDNADFVYPHSIQDALKNYILLGGKILFSLYYPSKAFELNAGYPAVFGTDSFMYDVLGIESVNYSVAARFKYALPNSANYPMLEVDIEKTIASLQGHIFGVEGMQTVNPSSSIYTYASEHDNGSSQGILNQSSVGVHHLYGTGQVICLSFPLYNMQTDSVGEFTNYVFAELFAETTGISSNTVPPIEKLKMTRAYPNPFVNETTFKVLHTDPAKQLDVSVYNLRGQRIQALYLGYPKANPELIWNAKDASGKPVSAGIYIIKAAMGKHSAIAKILKMH